MFNLDESCIRHIAGNSHHDEDDKYSREAMRAVDVFKKSNAHDEVVVRIVSLSEEAIAEDEVMAWVVLLLMAADDD